MVHQIFRRLRTSNQDGLYSHARGRMGALLCPILLVISSSAYGESLAVHGVSFPIDRKRDIDPQLVEIQIEGTPRIVPRNRVERYVVETYFKQPKKVEKILSPKEHERFITGAVDGGFIEDASLGLEAYILREDVTPEEVRGLIERLQRAPLTVQLLKRVLAASKGRGDRLKHLTPLLVEVGLADPHWLRSNLSGVVFADITDFKINLSQRFFRLLSEKDNEGAQSALELYRELTGGEDETYRKMLSVHQKVTFLLSDGGTQNISEAFSLIELLRQDEELEHLLRSLVVNLIHEKLQALLEKGRERDVLLLLSEINPTWRTPTSHEILLRSLSKIGGDDTSPLDQPHVARSLSAFSRGDERVRGAASEAYRRHIQHLLSTGSTASAQNVLAHLILVNPDPSPLNDEVRMDIASSFLKGGREDRARQLLREVSPGGLGISYWLRYLFWSVTLELSFVTLAFLGVLFTVGLAFLRIRAKRETKKRDKVEREQREKPPKVRYLLKEDRDEYEELPKFVRPPPRVPPEYLEHCELLETLGLDPGATQKEIKLAYRSLMKEVHPDAKSGDHKLASERFMRIQRAYERALELEQKYHFSEQTKPD